MTRSYNGWEASPDPKSIGVVPFSVAGVNFPGGVRAGDVAVVFTYLLTQFDARVEKLVAGWCWGYSYRQNRNADNLSCHASGTAVDANAPRHPNGKRGTFTPTQVLEILKILSELNGVVRWGGRFTGTPDEMHFEIVGSPAEVKAAADALRGIELTPEESKKLDDVWQALVGPESVGPRDGGKRMPLRTMIEWIDFNVRQIPPLKK